MNHEPRTANHESRAMLLAVFFALTSVSCAAAGTTYYVTRLDDPVVSAAGTLRKTLDSATSKDDVIEFAPALFENGPARCMVTNGALFMKLGLTLRGPGSDLLTLDAAGCNRIFECGQNVYGGCFEGLTFANGVAASGGAVKMSSSTSLLSSWSSLTLKNCVFTGNRATSGNGGAVDGGLGAASRIKVENCRFENNVAALCGGAVYYGIYGTAEVSRSCFRGNEAGENGGALAIEGQLTLCTSTFLENEAQCGGALHGLLNCSCVNSTFRGNRAASGGGIDLGESADSVVSLVDVVASGNAATAVKDTADVLFPSNKVLKLTANGVAAYRVANLTATNASARLVFGSAAAPGRVFEKALGAKTLVIDGVVQYVEPLKNKSYNPALVGAADAANLTDVTGRTFSSSQMGAFWCQADTPSLVVTTLDDAADETDGMISLRDVIEGLVDGEEGKGYRLLGSGGTYAITFASTLSGRLNMTGAQYEIKNLGGKKVTVDGDGRIAFVGTQYEKDEKNASGGGVVTNGFRAFGVAAGNALCVKNADFHLAVGSNLGAATTGYDGGAVLNLGTVELEGCNFHTCSAGASLLNPVGYGGALANGASGVTGANATLRKCTFAYCRAARGGAVYNYAGNAVDLADCTFATNRTGGGSAVLTAAGGALCNEKDGTLDYTASTFTDNTVLIEGVEEANDYADLAQPHCTVSVAGCALTASINALAVPDVTAESAVVDLTSSSDVVSVMPANVKPGLYYALESAAEPDGDYAVSAAWVRADENGALPSALTAPKTGSSGFYRVRVSLSPPESAP